MNIFTLAWMKFIMHAGEIDDLNVHGVQCRLLTRKSNPNITQWMEEMEFGDYAEVEQYYSNRLINITEELGSKYIIWQDPIDNNVTVGVINALRIIDDIDRSK